MAGAFVDDALICEAYIWALDKYRDKHDTRGYRLLNDDDFAVIYNLRTQLGREWAAKKHAKDATNKYYPWRYERLNELKTQRGWSQETRDLYASVLSSLLTWGRNGQNQKTKDRLRVLYPGASLCLQFLRRFPPQLTTKGQHDANPL